jgi:hypothetical protein
MAYDLRSGCQPAGVPPLDPIVSLTVAIAEAPGSFAFFLGSGVSRDAGVPTGDEVWWRTVGELWRLDHVAAETPSRDDLQQWLKATGRVEAGYSDVLEELMPEPASRRDYLSKLFATATPGPTHEALADLAVRGIVRVFVHDELRPSPGTGASSPRHRPRRSDLGRRPPHGTRS